MNWPISRMNDSETKERGLLGVKIQKLPGGVYLQTPLEACIFSARFGNQSVFILDPRLLWAKWGLAVGASRSRL